MAVACIPDLPSDPPALAGGFCGDGIIDLDAETCDPGPGAGDAGLAGCGANCQVQCPDGAVLWSSNNHCYQRVARARSLSQASFACLGGSHVVTFASEEEFQQVEPLADARPFWVGLDMAPSRYNSVAPFEPGWSLTCPGCYAHADGGLPQFPDSSTEGGPEDCIVALPDPQLPWQQYPCSGIGSRSLDVVCELEPAGRTSKPCEAGICIDVVKTYGAKHYVYQPNHVRADDAKQACAALGGRLVVLKSRDEREQIWRELSRLAAPPSAFWIGLSQVSTGSYRVAPSWAWDDGTLADGPGAYPSEWGDQQPISTRSGTATTRAFLWHQQPPAPDDTLARNDQVLTTLPYVCEITADTLAAAAASEDAGHD
jgi:hypothetical protein